MMPGPNKVNPEPQNQRHPCLYLVSEHIDSPWGSC